MDIATLRTFLAAADTGSFAAAAKRVHASPSSVTERIKQLEHRIGVSLFERDKRGCRLTAAGRKFRPSAAQAVRAIDIAQHEVRLPDRYTRSVSFGGQYILWDRQLLGWLAEMRIALPDVAWRVTSGASARLNRDLSEGFLDIAVLYDPAFRRDIGAEPVFDDDLVLVTGGEPDHWRDDYVRVEWGREMGPAIASRLDLAPESGLVLDLGGRTTQWLITHGMAGYMPRRSVRSYLETGTLQLVDGAPSFPYPAYVCWNREMDCTLSAEIVGQLRKALAEHS